MSARRRSLLMLVLSACNVHATPHAIAPPVPPVNLTVRVDMPSSHPLSPERSPAIETYRGHPLEALLRDMATRPVVRRLGRHTSTSVVYHLQLEGGLEVAFKPALPGQQGWWHNEVTAFHLAHVLGLTDRVPPAVARRVPFAALGPGAAGDEVLRASDDPSMVPGAMMAWVPVLRPTHLDLPHARTLWQRWLDPTSHAAIANPVRAADLSAVILFDYLQANDDRWNESNVAADEADRLVFRDNNAGWFTSHLRDVTWNEPTLRWTRRFSRSFMAALDRATPDVLAADLAQPPGTGGPPLEAGALAAYGRRRLHLQRYIRQVRTRYGDAAVMVFP